MKILKNNSGFTLVETMVVAGILAILALGVATYMFNTAKQQKRVEVKNNYEALGASVNAVAQDAQSLYNSSLASDSVITNVPVITVSTSVVTTTTPPTIPNNQQQYQGQTY